MPLILGRIYGSSTGVPGNPGIPAIPMRPCSPLSPVYQKAAKCEAKGQKSFSTASFLHLLRRALLLVLAPPAVQIKVTLGRLGKRTCAWAGRLDVTFSPGFPGVP